MVVGLVRLYDRCEYKTQHDLRCDRTGRYPSTTHRVAKPRSPAAKARARVSFPLNVYVWPQTEMRVLPFLRDPNPRYTPIKAIHFHTRITEKYYGDGYAEGGGEGAKGGKSNQGGGEEGTKR